MGLQESCSSEPGPLGESLVKMCEAMRHRGADSTGFALYGEPDPSRLIVRARHPDASRALIDAENVLNAVRELGGDMHAEITTDDAVGRERPVPALRAALHGRHQAARDRDRGGRARHRDPVGRPLARDRQGRRRRAPRSTRGTTSRSSAAATASATCGSPPSRSPPSPTATRSGPSRSPTSRSSTTGRSRTTTRCAAS